MRFAVRAVVVALTLASSVSFAAVAYSAPPYSTPQQVFATGFESGEPSLPTTAHPLPEARAYWGTSSSVFKTGAMGLWCAGTDKLSGAPGSFWPEYPASTMGSADVRLTELQDYFSSSVSYWHYTKSIGPEDHFTITIARLDAEGKPVIPSYIQGDEIGENTAWTQGVYHLGPAGVRAASRQPLLVRFAFIDNVENEPFGTRGQGPAIDDVAVTGYKYGPVRALTGSWSSVGGGVELSWQLPAENAVSTADDSRPMVYRVWRSLRGADQWTELTADAPLAGTNLHDDTAEPARIYEYVVQAWDIDGVSSHGVQALPVSVTTPGAPAPPVARDDAYEVDQGKTLAVSAPGVLGNDESQASRSAALGVAPSQGALTLTTEGSFTYTPPAGWSGTVSFSYRAVSQSVYSEPASVTIVVHPIAPPPAPPTPPPAEAAPSATSIALTSLSRTLSRYGDSFMMSGRLESGGKPLPGMRVVLQTAAGPAGPFTDTTITKATAADGGFSLSHLPRSKTFYRVLFAGQSDVVLGSTSAVRSATPKAFVGTPVAPTTMRSSRASAVYGYLKPRHVAGSYPVRVYRYRYVGGKWKSYGYVKAKASTYSTYSKYTTSLKLPYRGRWKIRAYHPADSVHAAGWSGFDYVTVK